ncbi:MAG: type II secretion system protein GspE [Candidatus Rokuibacteriota bacterium]|nr:MAG: type II secretion system protein GspE [Candidatus Rokubacteria bacterium]
MTAQVFRNSRRDTLMSSSVSVTADTALSGAHRQAGAPVAAFHPREWISCAKTVVPRPDLCQVLVGLDQAAHRVWHITCPIDVPVEPSILASEAGASSEAVVTVRLGELLLAEDLITSAQLEEALRVQAANEGYAPLGHILVTQNIITRDQLVSVLERHRRSSKLGDLLLRSRELSAEQLETALAEQRRSGQALGEVLIRLGLVSEERMRKALCRQLHIQFFVLDAIIIDPTLRNFVNEKFAMKHRIVSLARVGNVLVVAMDDPTQTWILDDLQRSTGLKIEMITSNSAQITRALERLYRVDVTPSLDSGTTVDVIGEDADADMYGGSVAHQMDSADEIVRKLLRVAVDRGASDIHLETVSSRLQARFRIDGMLQHFNLGTLGDDLSRQRGEVLSRIKILATLDIAERRRPQDGSFRARVEIDGRVVPMDFRVSVIPSYYGENAVIRILDPRGAPDSLAALKLASPVTERLEQLIRSSAGTILVTGPTGSGKSTSLFAIMKSIYRPELKIVTAEDPIEYVCAQFAQHEVNERVGNTFAAYTRAFLRHDPEVIMLGEIRDPETAELAFRAAQTGHLVVSTLHTNDALGAITRLRDLGVDASVWTSSLLGVLAQRLVREICWNCKEEYAPPTTLLSRTFDIVPRDFRWYRGVGCATCHHTGYRRRVAISELWTPSLDDVLLINQDAPLDTIFASAQKNTYSMATDASSKLREHRTTLEELLRVLPPSALRELRTTLT